MYQGLRRVAVPAPARNTAGPKSLPAPTNGWVSAANLADAPKKAAIRLENFFPTQRSIRPRGGSIKWATIGEDPVTRTFVYEVPGTPKLFAADAGSIFDITNPADPDVAPDASVAGQSNGYYSVQQITTSGGTFLVVVNGADALQLFDGTDWFPITDEAIFALQYDAESGTFTAGETLTGGTSSATAEIVKVIDEGTTGTLWVRGIASGPFQNDEAITDGDTGAAVANIPSGVTQLTTAITTVATTALSAVWLYRSRLMFVAGGTLNAHYLDVDSIGGALGTLALGGVFPKGGSLLFGATWSLDAGDGVDDICVFVTDQGEMAVYKGLDPSGSDPGDFDLVGVYEVGKPMGKNATMRAGGDLLVMTEDGIVPVSVAINKDAAALSLSAVTRPIEPEWQDDVRSRSGSPWEVVKWTSRNMAVVAVPAPTSGSDKYCFVVNVETGAWAKYTGWDVQCLAVFTDRLFFGRLDGTIAEGEVGGKDEGSPYFPLYVGHAEHFGAMGRMKTVHMVRAAFIGSTQAAVRTSVSTNYTINLPAYPNAPESEGDVGWDIGVWDTAEWDEAGAPQTISTKWASVGRSGFAINPQVQMTVASVAAPDNELISIDFMLEQGGVVV